MRRDISLCTCLVIAISAAFLAFGMYHVHAAAGISEGGILGAVLLIHHWFQVSPAVSSLLMNAACYLLGWKTLGKTFAVYSLIAALGYSAGYYLCEQFPPLYPEIAEMPLLAAVLGSVFVGLGCGICVRLGGAPCGDDAYAMTLCEITGIPIQWIYLFSDLLVLGLSLSYIPVEKIGYSLLSVFLSGQIIGLLQKKRENSPA